jgi:DNA methylase
VTLLGAQKAQMVFTEPPYNVAIAGNVSGLGKVKHREFAMASGEMSTHEFTEFLETAFMRLADFSTNGSIHFICMDWRHIRELLEAATKPYSELKNLCVWSKTNAGMGSLYRSQHELILLFKKGTAPHVNNVEWGRFGRNRTNVWNYPGGEHLWQKPRYRTCHAPDGQAGGAGCRRDSGLLQAPRNHSRRLRREWYDP